MDETTTSNGAATVTIGGTTYRMRVPRSFADREDLVAGWRTKSAARSRGIFAATLALCVPQIAALVKDPIPEDGEFLVYGRRVYDALRGKGIEASAIVDAATACYSACIDSLYPRAEAVEKAEDFTADGAPPT